MSTGKVMIRKSIEYNKCNNPTIKAHLAKNVVMIISNWCKDDARILNYRC